MGTKNNPGDFDCYQAAEPDEPMFVLLGRDPLATFLVELWADVREEMGGADAEKVKEAYGCSRQLELWAINKGKDFRGVRAAFERVLTKRVEDMEENEG